MQIHGEGRLWSPFQLCDPEFKKAARKDSPGDKPPGQRCCWCDSFCPVSIPKRCELLTQGLTPYWTIRNGRFRQPSWIALQSYDVRPISWSKRQAVVEGLTAWGLVLKREPFWQDDLGIYANLWREILGLRSMVRDSGGRGPARERGPAKILSLHPSLPPYSWRKVRVTCKKLSIFLIFYLQALFFHPANNLFHTLWNDLSTIARYRIASIW